MGTMQPESLLMGAGSSMAVTSHWKSNEMLNWSVVTQGNATALGDMEMPANPRSHYGQFSPSTSVFLAVLMTLLVFATVLGNALVILAFVVEKSLRTQGNFFFFNLAIADLLVGGFCIPAYIPYVITGEWRLGRGLCKIWLVVDYTLCTASVFNIVLISFDRFISVTRAVSYRCQKGVTREAVLKMLSVWLAAFLLYGPAIIIWEYIAGSSVVPDKECHAEFYFNWRRNQVRDEQPVEGPGDSEMEALKAGVQHVFFVRPVDGEAPRIPNNAARLGGIPSTAKVSAVTGNSNNETSKDHSILDLPPLQVGDVVQHSRRTRFQAVEPSFSKQRSQSEVAASRFRLSKDKKVAKSLAVIVCVFGLCWAPYTLLMIIRAACHAQCVQHYLYEISFWLLWVNSSINPVLYPLCHTSFRKAFRKLLCTTKIKIQPQYMEQMY
ncbi:histamine H3 receptor-like isoform X2 [Oncorhynchus tshawytscha]|uniref:G-protein coupled receptors family 1 profile domain-containing protein n=1 Tax=Oncorhynchus tshawytscha TaxID=74940 RepID=A0A8C8ERT5_ONCTS|nr:histamine H3 receptor-like isoform X2 [Oncorhynchus tshawytscha]